MVLTFVPSYIILFLINLIEFIILYSISSNNSFGLSITPLLSLKSIYNQ
jgi:hypothetical protein